MSLKACLSLLLLLLLAACSRRLPPDTLVEVNGQAITARDLERELKMQGQAADRPALLEDLIDQAFILQEAAKSGVSLSSDDLDNQLVLARAGTLLKDFQEALKARGLSYEDWKENVRRQALCDETVRRQIRSQLVIRRQDLKDYYWEHVTQFRRPEAVKLRQIYVTGRARAEKALKELELGEPFEAVAASYSKSPEGVNGGDLGWVTQKMLPARLAKAAFALKKGKISSIVASAYGYHILRVDDRRPESAMSLDEAAPEIHESLLREREQPLYRDWLFELRSHSEIKRKETQGNKK